MKNNTIDVSNESLRDAAELHGLKQQSLRSYDDFKDGANWQAAKDKVVIDKLSAMLREVYFDYSHPNFTDRHQTAPRIKQLLESINKNYKHENIQSQF